MKEGLENYLNSFERQGFLRREKIGDDQIKALLLSASKNIVASEKNLSIDEEACYTLAYNAMIKIARALSFCMVIGRQTGNSTRQQSKLPVKSSAAVLKISLSFLTR